MAKEIEELKASIKKNGYDWTAAETSMSKLSEAEQKKRLGLLVTDAELEEMRVSIEFETGKELELLSMMTTELKEKISYPAAFDWRNYNGKDWTLPVRDQGSCGSCVAFGTVAAIESTMKIAGKNPNLAVNLSEAFLLFCGGGSCSGWSLEPPLNFAKSTGITDEACFPYKPRDMPCSDRCSDWTSRVKNGKIKSWTKLSTITQRKNWISSKGPVTGGMAVYADFINYSGGVYRHTSGSLRGYHCICIVGYSEREKCWICKNSWGTGWGDNGYFKIGYGECKIDTSFPMYGVEAGAVVDTGCGFAKYVLIDYYFGSSLRRLWAYIPNKGWKYKNITETQVVGIGKDVMEADRVYVCWKGRNITFIRAWEDL